MRGQLSLFVGVVHQSRQQAMDQRGAFKSFGSRGDLAHQFQTGQRTIEDIKPIDDVDRDAFVADLTMDFKHLVTTTSQCLAPCQGGLLAVFGGRSQQGFGGDRQLGEWRIADGLRP